MEVGYGQRRIVLTDEQHRVLLVDFLFGLGGGERGGTLQRRAPLRKGRPPVAIGTGARQTLLAAPAPAPVVPRRVLQLPAPAQRLVLAAICNQNGSGQLARSIVSAPGRLPVALRSNLSCSSGWNV